MAGRVERRINNKFYFVLDEVGGSSDCESELTDAEAKPTDVVSVNIAGENVDQSIASKKDAAESVMKTENVISPESTDNENINANTLNYSNVSGKSDARRDKNKINHVIEKEISPPKDIEPEETSAVVDMDIDSDFECGEPKIKPLLRVTFRDEAVEELLKTSLYKFISQKFIDCAIITNSENSLELEVYERDPRKLPKDDLVDFNLDTTPSDSHLDVPHYGRSHDLVLSDKVEHKSQSGKLHSSGVCCFNCLGSHNLKDCTENKDFRVIKRNRTMFQNKTQRVSRYHLDENQKFSHITPGVISKKLRHALNLKRDQQPGFIYKMRLLGYPPAWLEEAKVSHSGVAMYDSIGIPVLEEDEEEGEIVPEGAKDKFDISKIIEFPGFNVPLPNNFKDESKLYHCPALSEDQSKENLIKLLEPKTVQAYVKKSLASQKSEEPPSQNEVKRIPSPTIEEMEEKKRQLLMELNDEDSACSQTQPEATPKELGSVKKLEFGTPILKSVSPFLKLPSREQFSVNVSDVINFENLPNSTGKYETMREVITKIRTSTFKAPAE